LETTRIVCLYKKNRQNKDNQERSQNYNLKKIDLQDNPEHKDLARYWQIPQSEKRAGKKLKTENHVEKNKIEDFIL
jgi:hypothetical protein